MPFASGDAFEMRKNSGKMEDEDVSAGKTVTFDEKFSQCATKKEKPRKSKDSGCAIMKL